MPKVLKELKQLCDADKRKSTDEWRVIIMNVKQLLTIGLTLLGVGAVGYKTYQLKKESDAVKKTEVIEIAVESTEEPRK